MSRARTGQKPCKNPTQTRSFGAGRVGFGILWFGFFEVGYPTAFKEFGVFSGIPETY